MFTWLLPLIFLLVIAVGIQLFCRNHETLLIFAGIVAGICLVIFPLTIFIDYKVQTTDYEIWSGHIVDWDHDEEWEEWIPPQTTCTTTNGKQSCTTTPGYWRHHYAENHIKTTDNGWVSVSRLPDGTRMDDSYPNKTSELKKYFPEGTPTASRHAYENKIQASYSIFKNRDIDLADYPDLPEYPDKVHDKLYVNRLVGYKVPKNSEASKKLEEVNSKIGSSKQVNMVFANLGPDAEEEAGFALQDKWEGGNKNDFVVAFSLNENNEFKWVHVFSWSEIDILKLEVKDLLMDYGKVKNFSTVVEDVSDMVEEKFVRKEFADFSYIHIEVSMWAQIFLWFIVVAYTVARLFFFVSNREYTNKYSRW